MTQQRPHRARHGFTLIEVLIVITVLGIAAAMVVPAMGGVGVLRVQAAVRAIVADITSVQSEALAYQKGRAIVFDTATNSWTVIEINGTELNPETDTLSTTAIKGSTFGDSVIESVDFGGGNTLYFDESGSPVTGPLVDEAAPAGTITIKGSDQTFRITVEAYTGRVTVEAVTQTGN